MSPTREQKAVPELEPPPQATPTELFLPSIRAALLLTVLRARRGLQRERPLWQEQPRLRPAWSRDGRELPLVKNLTSECPKWVDAVDKRFSRRESATLSQDTSLGAQY